MNRSRSLASSGSVWTPSADAGTDAPIIVDSSRREPIIEIVGLRLPDERRPPSTSPSAGHGSFDRRGVAPTRRPSSARARRHDPGLGVADVEMSTAASSTSMRGTRLPARRRQLAAAWRRAAHAGAQRRQPDPYNEWSSFSPARSAASSGCRRSTRLDHRHGDQDPRVRSRLPPSLTLGEQRSAADRQADATRRSDPANKVYRVGKMHFVRDGHHRVSVARDRPGVPRGPRRRDPARVSADRALTLADLPLKGHERLFRERVPLPAAARPRAGRPQRSRPLRATRRGGRGLGLSDHAGSRGLPAARRRGSNLVRGRVHPGGRDASRRGPGFRGGNRGGGLHPGGFAALPAVAHP